jgi:hypothetical protein
MLSAGDPHRVRPGHSLLNIIPAVFGEPGGSSAKPADRMTFASVILAEDIFMKYRGVEYSVVQLINDSGWQWKVRLSDGKTRVGISRASRAAAIKSAQQQIDKALEAQNNKPA